MLLEKFFDIIFESWSEMRTKFLSTSLNPVSMIPDILNRFALGIPFDTYYLVLLYK